MIASFAATAQCVTWYGTELCLLFNVDSNQEQFLNTDSLSIIFISASAHNPKILMKQNQFSFEKLLPREDF